MHTGSQTPGNDALSEDQHPVDEKQSALATAVIQVIEGDTTISKTEGEISHCALIFLKHTIKCGLKI